MFNRFEVTRSELRIRTANEWNTVHNVEYTLRRIEARTFIHDVVPKISMNGSSNSSTGKALVCSWFRTLIGLANQNRDTG